MTGTARMGKKRLIAGLTLVLGVAVVAGPSESQAGPTFWDSGDVIVADQADSQVEAVNPGDRSQDPRFDRRQFRVRRRHRVRR